MRKLACDTGSLHCRYNLSVVLPAAPQVYCLSVVLPASSQGRNVIRSDVLLFVFQQGVIGPPGENGAPGPIGLLVSIFLLELLFRTKHILSNITV